ncbi:MAG: hypothetical protein FWE94_07145 [Coriobacteriia bacterium]|nr:hypothetical protein [Coriobacteriia bacterium]
MMKALKTCGAALFVCIFLTGCSGPIFGRNVENFVEHEQAGTAPIPGEVSTVFYYKVSDDKDEAYFIAKNLADETEGLIFRGPRSQEIERVLADKASQRVYYTLQDWRENSERISLIVYDLASMQEASSILVFDRSASGYQDKLLLDMLFDESHDKIIFQIGGGGGSTEFLVFDIATEKTEAIAQGPYYEELFAAYEERLASLNEDRGDTKMLFEAPLYEGPLDPHNSYYKPKYAGIYVDDGTNNIRVSRNPNGVDRQFWLDDQKYVISGAYLYDASGRMTERQLIDYGWILAISESQHTT